MNLENILFLLTASLTFLLAGVFFGYVTSVNGGLSRLKNSEYIKAMQSINIVIINPFFMSVFIGSVILLPLITFINRNDSDKFAVLLIASVIYIFGSFILTIAGNIPLNEELAKIDLSKSSEDELQSARNKFEKPWNNLHFIRTIASIISAILIISSVFV